MALSGLTLASPPIRFRVTRPTTRAPVIDSSSCHPGEGGPIPRQAIHRVVAREGCGRSKEPRDEGTERGRMDQADQALADKRVAAPDSKPTTAMSNTIRFGVLRATGSGRASTTSATPGKYSTNQRRPDR